VQRRQQGQEEQPQPEEQVYLPGIMVDDEIVCSDYLFVDDVEGEDADAVELLLPGRGPDGVEGAAIMLACQLAGGVCHLVTVGKTVHMGLGRSVLVRWSCARYWATRGPYLVQRAASNEFYCKPDEPAAQEEVGEVDVEHHDDKVEKLAEKVLRVGSCYMCLKAAIGSNHCRSIHNY
jgi:hypothetical protein